MTSAGPQESLSSRITQAVTVSDFPKGSRAWFAPRQVLDAINDDSITQHFSTNPNSGSLAFHVFDESVVKYILKDATELFAICVAISIPTNILVKLLQSFERAGVTDANIPGCAKEVAAIFPDLQFSFRWNLTNQRYMFRAPVLSREMRHRKMDLHDQVPFPIDFCDTKTFTGGFGTVYKVSIHEMFMETEPINETSRVVAIKEYPEGKYPKAWQREVNALKAIGSRNLSHVVDVKAIFTQASKIYLVFPWADGGDLRNFWERRNSYDSRCEVVRHFLPDIMRQLRQLSSALESLHDFKSNGRASYRHGDLKPENILVFPSQQNPNDLVGTWKMSDLGLAKMHEAVTGERYGWQATSMRGLGTTSYKPPEAFNNRPKQATSRLFDIWSMGCITLQLITWLIYGMEGLNELTCTTASRDKPSCFWIGEYTGEKGWHKQTVHGQVTKLINKLRARLNGSPVLFELLSVVDEELLVIETPHPRVQGVFRYRTNAHGLHESLRTICDRCDQNHLYWSSSWKAIQDPIQGQGGIWNNQRGGNQIYDYPFDDKWAFQPDNAFAESVLRESEGLRAVSLAVQRAAKLCATCQQLDFGVHRFQIIDTLDRLNKRSRSCDFCKLRWKIYERCFTANVSPIIFDLVDSNFELNGRYPPVLTVVRGRDVARDTSAVVRGLQIGGPQLPELGSKAYFDVLQHWLLECDQKHTSCRSPKSIRTPLPTRLIDVGSKNSPFVKLYETQRHDRYNYLALSHPWGDQSMVHFCTFRGNLTQHKKGIELDRLPATFQDAVRVTRGLGHRYLWIDSICIIQGPDGDFNDEAKRMEDVYSQAYCVLAASSASGQRDGFLHTRDERRYITFRESPLPPLYVCEFTDNFQQHVLDSHLNKRGWVLQERVLARRTIYFTKKQTYWECGRGVRCETMTNMHNQLASFLGDPNFPQIAMDANRGGKIRLYQDLYARYSRLGFSHYEDRPVAIAGLEKRLISSLGLRGGFGMLDDTGPGLLRRSLLWCRGEDEHSLEPITFNDTDRQTCKAVRPPTWSWMAYKGAIDYLDPPFDQVEWEMEDIISPWATNALGTWSYSRDISVKPRALRVIARDFDAAASTAAAADGTAKIIIDTQSSAQSSGSALKCVVLGRLKDESEESLGGKRHFVMLVKPSGSEAKVPHTYLRAGVGFMPGSLIHSNGTGAVGHVL